MATNHFASVMLRPLGSAGTTGWLVVLRHERDVFGHDDEAAPLTC